MALKIQISTYAYPPGLLRDTLLPGKELLADTARFKFDRKTHSMGLSAESGIYPKVKTVVTENIHLQNPPYVFFNRRCGRGWATGSDVLSPPDSLEECHEVHICTRVSLPDWHKVYLSYQPRLNSLATTLIGKVVKMANPADKLRYPCSAGYRSTT